MFSSSSSSYDDDDGELSRCAYVALRLILMQVHSSIEESESLIIFIHFL